MATTAQDDTAFSRPRGPSPASVTVYVLAALLVAAVLWAALGSIDVRVAGRGKLVNDARNIVVRTLEPGVLASVAIRPGQVVRKGDVIATLDPTFAGADVAQLAQRELSLRAQVERLRRQAGDGGSGVALAQQADQKALLAERQAAFDARMRQFEESLARLRASLDSNAADQKVTAERVRSLLELEQMQDRLAPENFVSRSRVLETRERRLEAERELTAARGRQHEIEREVRVTAAERDSFSTAFKQRVREELSQTLRDNADAREQLTKAQRRAQLVTLVAPQDAVVLEVRQTSIGGVLNPSDVFATLVPLGEALLAEAEIDPADIAEVRVGDRVRLKLDAYPFQKYGVLEGRIQALSGDAVTLDAAASQPPRTVYLARVALSGKGLSHSATAPSLLPGMTLTAEVIVGQRTILSYFLYPLTRVVDEAMREK